MRTYTKLLVAALACGAAFAGQAMAQEAKPGVVIWGRVFERHPGLKLVCVEADAGCPGPEVPALERVGGQLESVGRMMLQRSEIRPMPAHVGRGDGVGDLTAVGDTLAHGHDGPRRGEMLRPDLNRGPGEHRLGTDLHQHRAAQRRHGAHTLGELHWVA